MDFQNLGPMSSDFSKNSFVLINLDSTKIKTSINIEFIKWKILNYYQTSFHKEWKRKWCSAYYSCPRMFRYKFLNSTIQTIVIRWKPSIRFTSNLFIISFETKIKPQSTSSTFLQFKLKHLKCNDRNEFLYPWPSLTCATIPTSM